MRKSLWGFVAVAVVLALGVSGCATKTYVDEKVAAASQGSDTKIAEVQSQVETVQTDVANLKKTDAEHAEQIAKLSETTREALARANEAGKLAKGKFLFEETLTDDAVKFGFNKADVSPEAKAALDAFAGRVKAENKNVFIEIQGHTDNIGSEKVNLKLGQERAENVMRYLNMQHGVPLHRINVISYGEYKPIADNKGKDGRGQNRRVTLVVLE